MKAKATRVKAEVRSRLEDRLEQLCTSFEELHRRMARIEAQATGQLLQQTLDQKRRVREAEEALQGERAALEEKHAAVMDALEHQEQPTQVKREAA